MMKFFWFVLIGCSVSVYAGNKTYSLKPTFNGIDTVEFLSVDGESGETLKGYLTNKGTVHYSLPDICEPEGGDAELSDAYTVKGKEIYFLFTCAWPVHHSGIGINGTQYESFVYAGKSLASIIREKTLSKSLSGYEGSLEEGGSSYAWYSTRKIASRKIIELEGGRSFDSLVLAHYIVLGRLNSGDIGAIRFYLDSKRIQQLLREFPVSKSTVSAYNDLGYALGQSGDNILAYEILRKVEKVSPGRVVLKLNIADVLWASEKEKSKMYYKDYIGLMRSVGKEDLIPAIVFERAASN